MKHLTRLKDRIYKDKDIDPFDYDLTKIQKMFEDGMTSEQVLSVFKKNKKDRDKKDKGK